MGALAVLSARQAPPEHTLVLIDKAAVRRLPSDVVALVSPVEELERAWIARVAVAALDHLSAAVPVQRLPAAAPGEAHYLVFGLSSDEAARLRARGPLVRADDSTWVLVAAEDRIRDGIPSRVAFKRLAGTAVGPMTALAGPGAEDRAETRAAGHAAPVHLADLVSTDRLRNAIAALEGFVTRYASTSACEAAGTYVLEHFRRAGLPAEPESFTFGTTPRYTTSNIVATLPGRVDPSRIVIVGAHYDSFSDQRPSIAPGADDNASGTAAVMEAATVLAGQSFDFTIRFVAFGAEEWGLIGSQYHAEAARQRGEAIVAVVSLDMIGYADRLPEDLDIVGSAGSGWLADRVAAVAAAAGPMPSARTTRTTFGSDCSPFWQQGYPAICGIEDVSIANPYYHRTTDRLDTLDMNLVTAITRTTVAAVADLAQPVSVPLTPAGLVAQAQVNRSLFLRARSVALQWRAASGGATGYNVYRAATSHGSYQKLNASPVGDTSYEDAFVDPTQDAFYVVTALDAAGRESNYSGEAGVVREAVQ